MPKVLYIEPYSGIAGDMFAGSTIGLLENKKAYFKQINSLPIKTSFEVKISKTIKSGITADKFDVIIKTDYNNHENQHGRHLSEIVSIIKNADKMSEKAKCIAIKIFNNLANAEAKIHGSTTDKVHFHEVGAIDAIVDICSAAIILDQLNVEKVISAPISIGTGTVKTSHGILPVPAPATSLLLRGIPINKTNIKSEISTPTGVAILKTIVDSWDEEFHGKILKSNYSAGTKEFKEITNILRTSLIEEPEQNDSDRIIVIECNLDDYPGEHFTYLEEAIFKAGALDYIIIPGTMKKSRPGMLLQVISPKVKLNEITDTILQHTSTNGIRYREDKRIKLERKIVLINTPFGEVEVKLIYKNNIIIKGKPEQRDIKRIALNTNKSYVAILNEVNYHIQKWIYETIKP